MIPMIVVTTYIVMALITGRLTVYTIDITKANMTGEDFVFLPLVSLLWVFSIWFVGFFAIEHWWDNREERNGRPQWVVDLYVTLFGIKG